MQNRRVFRTQLLRHSRLSRSLTDQQLRGLVQQDTSHHLIFLVWVSILSW